MSTYIAMLRGINVSGQKKILMADLKKLVEGLKLEQVQTYIQSGNIVFSAPGKTTEKALREKLEQAIRKQYGFDVPVMIRSAAEMNEAVAANPYIGQKGTDPDKLHITFLDAAPVAETVEALKKFPCGDDSFICTGRELYLHCPGGYGNTKLNNSFFEQKLKIKATTRNWRTVQVLAEMATKK